MKRTTTLLLALILLVSLFVSAAETTVEIVDQAGRTVNVEQPVDRVVSVYGMGTYYVYALGAPDRLVRAWYIGLKSAAQASESMHRLEPRLDTLLTFGDPSVEEMVSLDADLIFVDGSRHASFADQMRELGVPVLQFLVETPEALKEGVLLAGAALGVEAFGQAQAFVADYDRVTGALAADRDATPPTDRTRVLFVGTDPLKVASGSMYQTLMIEAAGGVSVSRELTGSWNEVNLEQVLIWNLDVIIIPPYGPVQPETLLADADWQSIAAVQSGRVYRMPRLFAPMDTPVPESLLGVVWLADVFYPDTLSVDLSAETEAFYRTYYGYSLQAGELEMMTRR